MGLIDSSSVLGVISDHMLLDLQERDQWVIRDLFQMRKNKTLKNIC